MIVRAMERQKQQAPLLVVRHVPWEGPHRILDAFAGVPVHVHDAFDAGAQLPPVADVRAAIFMGGPMSANDSEHDPSLAAELQWIRDALAAELPLLGVCLGSQLLALALGGRVVPGATKEIGFAPIEVLDERDPLLGTLSPSTTVLHWHGELIELPAGTPPLARSAVADVQAFRAGRVAWGLLFHAEGDAALVEHWLAEPSMADEAREQSGEGYAQLLRSAAASLDPRPGRDLFTAFAELCALESAA
jgi:GMP synthase (glutamine-hydrolysing)